MDDKNLRKLPHRYLLRRLTVFLTPRTVPKNKTQNQISRDHTVYSLSSFPPFKFTSQLHVHTTEHSPFPNPLYNMHITQCVTYHERVVSVI